MQTELFYQLLGQLNYKIDRVICLLENQQGKRVFEWATDVEISDKKVIWANLNMVNHVIEKTLEAIYSNEKELFADSQKPISNGLKDSRHK